MSSSAGPPNTSQAEPTRLRQIALVARDLEAAKELITSVIGTEVCYVDPGVEQWGLENFLVPVGGEIIEVVSPNREGTTAGRLLDRRGDGGYMIIMQTTDALKRKEYIESKRLAKVIWTHASNGSIAVQYHPKGIAGGVIPELDSQTPNEEYPNPLTTRIAPWHACGPDKKSYLAAMKKHAHLSLLGAVCRINPDEPGSELAATQWQEIFGVGRIRNLLGFTNARVGFVSGEAGKPDGIISITIGVHGQKYKNEIIERAQERGLYRDGGVYMLGVRWNFSLTGDDEVQSRL